MPQENQPPSALLIVFLKVPRPGLVKTRLAAAIGAEAACAAYEELVSRVLVQIRGYASVELRITPDDGLEECQHWLLSGWKIKAQGGGGLGERLSRAFDEAFTAGWERVLAIGTDCPDVGMAQIQAGIRSLDQDTVVLGPAIDGGYWLIGMKEYLPELFQGIDWSTEHVFSQTRQAAQRHDASVAVLETLEDIDELEAWNRYRNKKS